jgi:monooxygenase
MSVEGTDVTFVNRFTVHGDSAEFERVFADTAVFLTRQPGFIRHTLVRHLTEPGSYVNIAHWSSETDLRRAVGLPEFQAHAKALRAVSSSEPNLYRQTQLRVAPGTGSS